MGLPGQPRFFQRVLAAVILSVVSCGSASAQVPTADVAVPRFEIKSIEVDGNTLLTPADVESAVAPYRGQQKDFADIQRALESLEHAYIERGYGVVQVLLPEQDITRGTVRLQVIEPAIGKVVIEGNKYFNDANVRASLPGLQPGATPNSQRLATNLQMLAEQPAKRTSVLLKAGTSDKDVDAVVTVADEKPLKFVATFDNSGVESTGNYRIGIAMQHSNLFNRDHTLTLQAITSPENPDKVKIFGGGYRIPFYAYSSSLDFFAGYSDVSSGTLGGTGIGGLFNVSGAGTVFGVRYNWYLPKIGEYEHKLALGLDYRAYQSQVVPVAGGFNTVPDITVFPASIAYSGLWRTIGTEAGYYVSFSRNIPGSNDGGQNSFWNGNTLTGSRLDATANYHIVRWGANATHVFGNDWQVRAVVNGQYSSDALVQGEQFGVGGPDSVRGFNIREFAGDKGYAASLELYTPELSRKIRTNDWKMRFLAFYDTGGTGFNSVPAGQSPGQDANSVGVGLRMTYGKHFNLRVDYAQVTHAAGAQAKGDQMLQGLVAIPF
jgi:hemolysin activation/secretion protein